MCSTSRPTEVGGGGSDDDDDDDDRCEYATLTCRGPAAAGCGETKVHLKVTFHDDRTAADSGQATVLRVRALVVGAEASGVYEGRVSGHQAAAVKTLTTTTTDDSEDRHATAVRRWLDSARHALVGRRPRDSDDDDARFVHCLERAPCGGDGDRPAAALVLTWKKKLRPLGSFALGSVRLCGRVVDDVAAGPVCGLFVEPLIGRLRAERRRGERAERAAAEDARLLMADNGRLLDALRSAADGRRLEERELMARFVEVLNAKKKKLDAVRRELSDLREQLQRRGGGDATEQDVVVVGRRRGRGVSRGRARKRSRPDRGRRMAAAKRGRRRTSSAVGWCPSEEDDVDADDRQQKRQEDVMETDDRVTVSVVEVEALDDCDQQQKRQEDVMETDDRVTTNSAVEAESAVNFNIFEADTQIDDSPPSSPPWFQQSSSTKPHADRCKTSPSASSPPSCLQRLAPTPFNVTDSEPSPGLRQPTRNENVGGHQQGQKKSVLDDLWSGIV